MSFSNIIRNSLPLALLVMPSACGGAPETDPANRAPERPRFEISTQEAFDPASIDPYLGDHSQVYAYIDENLDDHLANLQRWLRQPSVSALKWFGRIWRVWGSKRPPSYRRRVIPESGDIMTPGRKKRFWFI